MIFRMGLTFRRGGDESLDHGFHREQDVRAFGRVEMRHPCWSDFIIQVLVLKLSHHVLKNRAVTALTCTGGSTHRDSEVAPMFPD